MLSDSPTGNPASPMLEMWTKAKMRLRELAMTECRRAPKLLAPASPAETYVVVAVKGVSSSAGRPSAEPSG